MSSTVWADLPNALGGEAILEKLNEALKTDAQYLAFTNTGAIVAPTTFGIKTSGNDATILVTFSNGKGSAKLGSESDALFTLSALPEQWEQFFKPVPVMPYQSYWPMFHLNVSENGMGVKGSEDAFAHYNHVWRRVLELLHDAHSGPTPSDPEPPETDEDFITGWYIYVTSPIWGRSKVFVEKSGTGRQQLLFLHTAGADSRQYHGVMNDKRMRERCTMWAFDLPNHGRSFPSQNYVPGAHTNVEDSYVGCITAVIKKLGLSKPIVCGASMAGQVCLAIAIRNEEVGTGGVIPLQASEYVQMPRTWHDQSPYVNQSLFNPEYIYGMTSPTAPLANRRLIWHLYSAQAYGIFHGDLDFYFGGWDGRERVASINTGKCPVYMLTGEYDWSTTPQMAEATAKKIPGATHTIMKGLGHFPATENPSKFVEYLVEAVAKIQKEKREKADLSVLRMTDD